MTTKIVLSGGDLGSEKIMVKCDLTRASAPVMVDYCEGEGWQPTQWQCANCSHRRSGLVAIGKELAAQAVDMTVEQFTCEAEDFVDHNDRIIEAANHIDATLAADGEGWVYRAQETSEWYRLTDADLIDLYDMLHHSDDEIRTSAYSHWCAGTPGELIGDDDAAKAAGVMSK